jgi:hypothetical protein
MRCISAGVMVGIALCVAGCGGSKAVEGKTQVDSTAAFKHNKSTKSPPAQTPTK